ncbi:pyridine nucleotide-disulfide oxidoreductase [Carbonactinospora thermoautotrophica]|uniref:Putative flavoprotein oxidoreductase n=1 Tax=Carbonactinospora thermoautotrophica TaxID=1469144 RepID=A0A132N3Q5_9ACTN|nr:FAD-dependent oxidoreductase [Carbonactinospora thermoautotrophica]KWX01051.1 putative flavoprotein oxidoreductase [Carbonactinospora thermoautotrophica]KWX04723.1 pyridine nucleotide-disulfide oxidoreductase [Carbonactinospora thermoautotrophica]KWX05199.1 pyridine nucleotide-disulfide oxidoreductase [Carbonactinospora thermoautotrophica]
MRHRLVVVGGGAAGMSAASAARRVDPSLEIVVLEASGFAAYGLCGIPYYLSGLVTAADDLVAYPPAFFRDRRRINLKLNARATRLDPDRHVVYYVEDGREARMSYHRLVVATGGVPALPPVPGLSDQRVFTVRALEDAISLRSLLDAGRIGRALVVGAGYIGLEMAEALAARGVAVTVVEMTSQVMPNLDAPIAALVEKEVRRQGVDLRLGARLEEVRRTADQLEAVIDGSSLAVDVIVLAVGVRPGSDIAAAAGAATGPGGALLVDDQMRTSLPDVYAVGDCIAPYHRVLGRPAFVPLGPAANKTGRVAGTVAAGGDARFPGIVGTAVVKVFDLAVARTGLTLTEALAEGLPAVATDVEGRSRAKYYPNTGPVSVRLVHQRDGRLLGAQLVGAGDGVAKRIDALAIALQAGFDLTDLLAADLSYAPPYAPVYEPVLLAAQAAMAAAARPNEQVLA